MASKLNIRTGPGTNYDIIDTLEAGDSVTVVSTAGDAWVTIEYSKLVEEDFETRRGYVFRKFLSF